MTVKSKSRRQSRAAKRESNSIGLWLMGISIAIVVLVLALVGFNNSRTSSVSAIAPPDVPAEWVTRTSLGNPEAAVVIQAWEDFFCPVCGEWTRQIKPTLVEDYVKTGKVRFEFHQFPLSIHAPGALMAAQASECAADQGAFWPFHDRLFQVANSSGQIGFTLDALTQTASEMDLDHGDFLQCMSGQTHRAAVDESVNQGIAKGINATPSILINDKLVTKPFDYSQVSAEIDRLLEAAGSGD